MAIRPIRRQVAEKVARFRLAIYAAFNPPGRFQSQLDAREAHHPSDFGDRGLHHGFQVERALRACDHLVDQLFLAGATLDLLHQPGVFERERQLRGGILHQFLRLR